MKTTNLLLLMIMTGLITLKAEARLYRWVDQSGNVQYGDRIPPADAKNVTELDRRGIVRKAPEKPMSDEELAQKEAVRRAALEQTRKDRALLDSFTNVSEIDALRDRQISALKARQQANQARSKAAQAQLKQLLAQADALNRKKKTIPEPLQFSINSARNEVSRLVVDAKIMSDEMATITERAEADKKRFIELRGQR